MAAQQPSVPKTPEQILKRGGLPALSQKLSAICYEINRELSVHAIDHETHDWPDVLERLEEAVWLARWLESQTYKNRGE